MTGPDNSNQEVYPWLDEHIDMQTFLVRPESGRQPEVRKIGIWVRDIPLTRGDKHLLRWPETLPVDSYDVLVLNPEESLPDLSAAESSELEDYHQRMTVLRTKLSPDEKRRFIFLNNQSRTHRHHALPPGEPEDTHLLAFADFATPLKQAIELDAVVGNLFTEGARWSPHPGSRYFHHKQNFLGTQYIGKQGRFLIVSGHGSRQGEIDPLTIGEYVDTTSTATLTAQINITKLLSQIDLSRYNSMLVPTCTPAGARFLPNQIPIFHRVGLSGGHVGERDPNSYPAASYPFGYPMRDLHEIVASKVGIIY